MINNTLRHHQHNMAAEGGGGEEEIKVIKTPTPGEFGFTMYNFGSLFAIKQITGGTKRERDGGGSELAVLALLLLALLI